MVWLGFGLGWMGYAVGLYGYALVRGYNLTLAQMVSPTKWYACTSLSPLVYALDCIRDQPLCSGQGNVTSVLFPICNTYQNENGVRMRAQGNGTTLTIVQ